MTSNAKTPEEYIASLEPERKAVVEKIHKLILKNLPIGFEAGMQYGMLGYYVPHSVFPAGYHCDPKQPLPFMSLASQKQSVNLYHMTLYSNLELLNWFTDEFAKTDQKLDMGKSCIRFKKLDRIPYDLIAELASKVSVDEYIRFYTSALDSRTKK